MRKLTVLGVALGAVVSFIGSQGAVAQAATRVVDNDGMASATDCNATMTAYPTIGAAVADSNPGDIIKVCPGLYLEQVVIDKDNLTLLGAQAGVDARTRVTLPTDESIISDTCKPVQITTANNVVLDGFTVQNASDNPFVFFMCLGAGIWTNPSAYGKDGGYQILNNIVQNNIIGITPASSPTCPFPTLVQFNLIQNNNLPGPAGGTGIYTDFGLCKATIDSNKFSGHPNASVNLSGAQSDITISNNELVGGASERIFLVNTTMSSITGNMSIGSTSSGTIRLFSGNSNVTINSNTLFNGVRGIRVNDLDPLNPGANSNIAAHFNCIQGNSVAGLEVAAGDYTGTLNAENNWWGKASGPTSPNNPGGTGDAVIDPDGVVDFVPFLKSCPTGPAAPSMVTGGGQINVTGGRGSFGFSAKQDTQSGHLDYMNHVTRKHLNCKVDAVMIVSTTKAKLSGTCTPQSDASSFTADVEDNGKTMDKFKITYPAPLGTTEGDTIRSGNIQIK